MEDLSLKLDKSCSLENVESKNLEQTTKPIPMENVLNQQESLEQDIKIMISWIKYPKQIVLQRNCKN